MLKIIELSGIRFELTDDLRRYVEDKIGRLDRFAPRHARKSMTAEIRLSELKTKTDRNQCEVTLNLPDKELNATTVSTNMFAAVDLAEAKLKIQMTKYKDTHGGDKRDRRGILRRLRRLARR